MSTIAKKKAQMKKGPELILIYMGYVFYVVALIIFAVILIGPIEMSQSNMIPPIYFIILGAICSGLALSIRDNQIGLERYKDWLGSFIFLGILVGAILAIYMW